jgi:hypothetical protein
MRTHSANEKSRRATRWEQRHAPLLGLFLRAFQHCGMAATGVGIRAAGRNLFVWRWQRLSKFPRRLVNAGLQTCIPLPAAIEREATSQSPPGLKTSVERKKVHRGIPGKAWSRSGLGNSPATRGRRARSDAPYLGRGAQRTAGPTNWRGRAGMPIRRSALRAALLVRSKTLPFLSPFRTLLLAGPSSHFVAG